MAGGAHSREPRPFGWDIVKQHPGMASWQTATRWRKYLDRDKITFFYDRHTMMCRWFLALAFLLVATDFGKHLLILIQDHLVWLLQGASRVVFFYRYRAIHNCSMSHYCVLFYSLIWWYNGCRFSSHFDISLRKVRVSFTTQGHCKLSEISPALSGSKLSEIILDV